ncbi:MAG: replication-relaxation family protein [Deltaproteobacteria bacterium]|nr:replication-relaxation family protein [Deltaproteobacteria bacterium]
MEQIKEKRRWQLMDRDRAILRQIGEHGFSSAQWIREQFWDGKVNCIYYRRLSILRKMGLIEHLVGDSGKRLGYRLTKKGLNLLRSFGCESAEPSEYRASYRTTFNHDNYLVGLAAVFRQFSGIVEYWPEHQVRQRLALSHGYKERKRDGYKVPDALFTVQTKQRRLRVALELEIAPKAKAYYRRILRQLSKSNDFDMVFLVVADANTLERLVAELAWVRANDPIVKFAKRDNGFYFALLSDVLTNKGHASFRGEGAAFTLAQLAA